MRTTHLRFTPLLLLLALAACRSKPESAASADAPAPTKATAVTAPSDPGDLTAPPVANADSGLEATLLLATAPPAQVAAALVPYLDALPPVAPASLATIEANGFRLLRVPLADWPALSRQLRISSAAQRQWLPDSGEWTEIVHGPDRPTGQVVALDSERLELAPGRLRLLARCWLAALPPDSAAISTGQTPAELRIELLPQLQDLDAAARRRDEFTIEARATRPAEQGLTFPRLGLSMRIPGRAPEPAMFLLLAEHPDIDWRRQIAAAEAAEADNAEPPPRPPPAPGEVVRQSSRAADRSKRPSTETAGPSAADFSAGPASAALTTLGQAILGSPPTDPQRTAAAARIVLALIPRVPAEFRLLAPAPSPPAPVPTSPSKPLPARAKSSASR